jgi:hypothetical protein
VLRRIEPAAGGIDGLEESPNATSVQITAARTEAIRPPVPDAELETALSLHDQPRWVKDAVALSQRAREIITKLRPAAVHVFSFWDHRLRSIAVGDRRVQIDAAGCYRVEG